MRRGWHLVGYMTMFASGWCCYYYFVDGMVCQYAGDSRRTIGQAVVSILLKHFMKSWKDIGVLQERIMSVKKDNYALSITRVKKFVIVKLGWAIWQNNKRSYQHY